MYTDNESLILLLFIFQKHMKHVFLFMDFRVKSAHWRLKNTMTTSRGGLCQSLNDVNTMLKLQLGLIRVSFKKVLSILSIGITLHSMPCCTVFSQDNVYILERV